MSDVKRSAMIGIWAAGIFLFGAAGYRIGCLHGEPVTLAAEAQPDAGPDQKIAPPAPDSAPAVERCSNHALNGAGIRLLRLHIVSRIGDKSPDQRAKYAVTGQVVSLHAVLEARQRRERVYFTEARGMRIGRRPVPSGRVNKWPLSCQPKIVWFKVEATEGTYARLSRRNRVAYAEAHFARGWTVAADVHPTILGDQFKQLKEGLGVMRYKASLAVGARQLVTPGAEDLSGFGVSAAMHRVTFRPDTGAMTDYLFELFNMPYAWGSTKGQVDGQIAVDCADLMVYALRRSGKKIDYTWSRGMLGDRRRFRKMPSTVEVRPGDILYTSRHVGMVYEENGNGRLDDGDKVVHTLFHEPEVVSGLGMGHVTAVLRWKGD